MRQFTHIDAHSVGEVLALLDRYGEKAQVNAGGTDLMTVLKGDICPVYPEAIINLKTICGLDTIRKIERKTALLREQRQRDSKTDSGNQWSR